MSPRLVLVDADMLAGWRHSSSSLAQLHQAVLHLERQHPEVLVTVVADPALKWSLDSLEQPAFEADIVAGVVVCAPAGTVEGASGFLARVAEQAATGGRDVVAVTDRALSGVPLAKVACEAGRWSFDLDGATPTLSERRRVPSDAVRPRRARRPA